VNAGTWQALELLINGNASMDIPSGNLLRTNHLGHNALQLARNSQNAYRKKVLAIMEKGTSFAFHPSSKPNGSFEVERLFGSSRRDKLESCLPLLHLDPDQNQSETHKSCFLPPLSRAHSQGVGLWVFAPERRVCQVTR
jgi:hypothetical protein